MHSDMHTHNMQMHIFISSYCIANNLIQAGNSR